MAKANIFLALREAELYHKAAAGVAGIWHHGHHGELEAVGRAVDPSTLQVMSTSPFQG